MNNATYVHEGGKSFYERNKTGGVSPFVSRLLNEVDPKIAGQSDVCELGCGIGNNLPALAESYRRVVGYEVVPESVSAAAGLLKNTGTENASVFERDIIENPPDLSPFDFSIMGFFPYYCDDDDMETFRRGSIDTVRSGAVVYVYDFLHRQRREKLDAHTANLKVYKRDLQWWVEFFHDFDLIDFRLGVSDAEHHGIDRIGKVLSSDPDSWEFAALFQKR